MNELVTHLDSKITAKYPQRIIVTANQYFSHLVNYRFPEIVLKHNTDIELKNYKEIRLELIASGSIIVCGRELLPDFEEMWMYHYKINEHKSDLSSLWKPIYQAAVESYYQYHTYKFNPDFAWSVGEN
jgi:hypothetical protein